MVRSKFPGKPSKIVNRKVVKSSRFCLLQDNELSKAAENISYGLAVFCETFGDHEKVLTAFHGFSPHEVNSARATADKQQEKVEEEYKNSGLNYPLEDAFPVKIDPPTPQALSYVQANLSLIGPVGWHTTRAQCQSFQAEDSGVSFSKSTSPSKLFSPFRSNTFKKHVANRLLQKAKKANLDVSPASRLMLGSQIDKNNTLNRKFVLPSRSIRSRRVIKPNKKFLDTSGLVKDPPLTSSSSQPSHTRVIELKKPRLILDGKYDIKSVPSKESFAINSSSSLFSDKEHVKLAELNVFGAPTTRLKRKISLSGGDESPKKEDCFVSSSFVQPHQTSKTSESMSPSKTKVILRESKLNIHTGMTKVEATTGPNDSIRSSHTSLECAVCGSVCFTRFTKQAFKFGSACCETCRKFITRMMVRARSSENSVPCENGQGNCTVSSPLKAETFVTKVNRCGACWLLVCVQRLIKLPENTRDSLIRMLPANMQGMTVVLPPIPLRTCSTTNRNRRRKATRSQESHGNCTVSSKSNHGLSSPNVTRKLSASASIKRLPQTPIARMKRKAALVSLANNLRRVKDKGVSPSPSKKRPCSVDFAEKFPKGKTLSKKSETCLKKQSKKETRNNELIFKGPRVKHVCRSASIVLGQPLATFPLKSPVSTNDNGAAGDQRDINLVLAQSPSVDDNVARHNADLGDFRQNVDFKTSSTVENEVTSFKSEITSKVTSLPIPRQSIEARAAGRRMKHATHLDKIFQRGQRRTLQDLGILNSLSDTGPELVSLDFWESYDPDEICNAGFGLIGFDPFDLKPVCFLCGSAGTKKLIHCASCCEPYHRFCVEMGVIGGPLPQTFEQNCGDDWQVDWVCPRCTVCHSCGHNMGHQLIICQRCHNSYHMECLGTSSFQKSAGDRLWVCSACLRCKSCNSKDVTKFVGNLPFCKVCFKLRQKGNFCPLCQGCYTDDDYSSKMMECGDCKSWVHAKCEGLSDEKYQVLSYLPESVEFICRVCCAFPLAPWWNAVEAEIQAGFNNIVKALTKNRKTYALLKWSPQKSCECQHGQVVPNSRIVPSAMALGKRRLSFNFKALQESNHVLVAPSKPSHLEVASQADLHKDDQAATVFEFDEDIEAGEKIPFLSYKQSKGKKSVNKEYSNLLLDCGNDLIEKSDKVSQFSPNAGSQSDSGVGSTDDELKTCSAAEEDDLDDKTLRSLSQECSCSSQNSKHPFSTLLTIIKKVQGKNYPSVLQFHRDMDQLVGEVDSQEVKELYHQTLQEVFPWFDPKYDRVSRNSFPLSPCKPHHGSLLQYQSNCATPEKKSATKISSLQFLNKLLPKDLNELDDTYFYYGMNPADSRLCSFCKRIGDSDAVEEGRLLYCGHNEWVHVNCALWSAEVFEEIDGALQNVSTALSRGRMIRCSHCGNKGASVGCCAKKCEETLHFPCARIKGFIFMEDKNVFCQLHSKDAPGKPMMQASDFDVNRPVFVELDLRKKKSIESKHVRLMIGSLLIHSLGSLVPDMSDQGSILVPTQFYCTRLYWSSKEPWRVVRYSIRTSVRFPAHEPVVDLGHHITVDHSKEISDIPVKSDSSLGDRVKANPKCSNRIVKLSLGEASPDEKSEADEEVTQASADLLPPELKDAIMEDLPQDLLDAMQDIFQDKYLNFEELGKDESQDEISTTASKMERLKNVRFPRELKRSKSDVLPSNSAQIDSKLHRRSCSLAWSHKLGSNSSCCKPSRLTSDVVTDHTKLIQELRLSVKPASSLDLRYCLQGPSDKGKENQTLTWPHIMQVDGDCDLDLSDSDQDSSNVDVLHYTPHEEYFSKKSAFNMAEDSKILCEQIKYLRTITSAAQVQNALIHQHLVAENPRSRRRMVNNESKKKKNKVFRKNCIPQLDGIHDLSSDSEQENTVVNSSLGPGEEKPVQCSRCGCTYRTEESLARHLPNCTGDYSLTTSESETEISEGEASVNVKSVSAPSPDSAISVSSGSLSAAPPMSPTASLPLSIPVSAAPNSTSSSSINEGIKESAARANLLSSRDPPTVTCNRNQGHSVSTINKGQSKSKAIKVSSQQPTVKLVMKGNQGFHQHQPVFEHNSHTRVSHPVMQQSLSTSMPHTQATQMITMLDYQQSQQTGPTVIVQSVPSSTMVPAYLEAFQQQTGQNLQYLTTVDPNSGFGKTQYLAAVPSVIPGAYQLQAISDSPLCLEPSPVGIPALAGIQLAQTQLASAPLAQTQPQVLGTLVHNSLPCGVVATAEPIYETIQMFPDQSGGVLLASQPMLTCMETVVSNTFMSMSSSQFVSSTVPGMLQGSSTYSTTTTQVFQASKVEPPVLDVPTQYVVVNAQPSLGDSAVAKLGLMSISQSQVQERTAVQTQAQIRIPSINLPTPVSMAAHIPPQTLPPAIPTSVVAPVPRVQRTYSKPIKVTKDIVVVKKPVPLMTCSAVKETLKTFVSQGKAISSKQPSLSLVPVSTGVNAESVLQTNFQHQTSSPMKIATSNVLSSQIVTDSISTITAPAQSITLPDPVKSNHQVVMESKVLSRSGPVELKCPPATFSYRAQTVEKNKSRHSPASTSRSGPTSASNASNILSSVPKPTAAVPPQSQSSSQAGNIIQDLSVDSNVITVSANTCSSSQLELKIVNSVPLQSTNIIPQEFVQNDMGKNVSLSLMTTSISDSFTSPALNVTVSMNSSTNTLNSVVGQNPLKEIKQTSSISESKVIPSRILEKNPIIVPPTVLKSTSQNVGSPKKNDAYCPQNDIPVVFQNKEKSPASLKLLFQKQAHNGCYKVSSSPGKFESDFVAVKLADIITSGGKEKKGGKDESENVKPMEKFSKKSQSGSSGPEIVYEIHCQDGFSYTSTSISDAWQKVFGAVQEARANHKMPPLIHNPFNSIETGHNVMGLGNNSLKYLLEQLPGVGNCTKYRPVYHKSRLPGPGYQFKRDHNVMIRESHSGCARTEPYLSAKKYDMFSWLDSRHRRPPKLLENCDIDSLTGSRRAASTSLPMAMRFRHLRETSKTSVGVFRSDIHGRGLFCLRDIEAGEMVIEYAGEVIRNTLTDNREKYYQSKGIGCYMFKVDDNFTVDATQKGNAARFINHSCEPNCYSRVVDILGKKHIIIFAFRRIPQGEELTYDYKFPIEEEKIHCHCLARRCRKYLN